MLQFKVCVRGVLRFKVCVHGVLNGQFACRAGFVWLVKVHGVIHSMVSLLVELASSSY